MGKYTPGYSSEQGGVSTSYTNKSKNTNLNFKEKTGKALELSCGGGCKDKLLKNISGQGLMNNTVDKGNF